MRRIVYLFSLLICFACSDKNASEEIENQITVQVLYQLDKSPNEEIPDTEALVFLYYGKTTYDFIHYEYVGQGIFENGDNIIRPDQIYSTDSSGFSTINPLYFDTIFTLVVESNFYSPRLSSEVFPSVKQSINVCFVFAP